MRFAMTARAVGAWGSGRPLFWVGPGPRVGFEDLGNCAASERPELGSPARCEQARQHRAIAQAENDAK